MTAQTIQDIIAKETKQLPFEQQSEVLDFVLYLKTKNINQDKLDKLSLSLLQKDEIAHLEEEFANYKTLYPHE